MATLDPGELETVDAVLEIVLEFDLGVVLYPAATIFSSKGPP
jgi:hypothetical protein